MERPFPIFLLVGILALAIFALFLLVEGHLEYQRTFGRTPGIRLFYSGIVRNTRYIYIVLFILLLTAGIGSYFHQEYPGQHPPQAQSTQDDN